MRPILRKALWPATVVAGMLLLLGAVGTATAPTAFAADGEFCITEDEFITGISGSENVLGIQGPFPNFDDYGDEQDHNLLLSGQTYLFAAVVEDEAFNAGEGPSVVNISIDDEEGDADIESYADFATFNFVDLPGSGVDSIDLLDNFFASDWDNNAAFVDELEDYNLTITGAVGFDTLVDCDDDEADPATEDGLSFFTVTCDEAGEFEITAFEDGVTDNTVTNDFICYNAPSTVTLTATPATVESVPAVGNVSHSLMILTATDSAGNPTVPGWAVDWSVTGRCTIEALDEDGYDFTKSLWDAYKSSIWQTGYDIEAEFSGHGGLTATDTSAVFNTDGSAAPGYQPKSIAAAVLHCEGATPGVASVRAEVDRSPLSDLSATADVTVVGPPAFITMTAAPSKLVCGEKATILVTVTDSINQKVSDHTVVELITNYGGVIGGTGATLAFPGVNPVGPLSSGAAETFGGVATAYLLTSSSHVGAYEVVAAAGGSSLGGYLEDGIFHQQLTVDAELVNGVSRFAENIYVRNGVFSTPVVTSQVTVTCTAGAPAVTAPSTGTGTISPPNTGDAGLAARESSTASLFVIAGAVAFVLAGLASFGYARR